MSDGSALLEDPADGFDTAAAEDAAVGPVCSDCCGPLPTEQTPVCPHCGWYAALGVHVDIEEEWERAVDGDPQAPAPQSHLEVWATLVPAWGWVLMATALSVVLVSVAVRVLNPEVGGVRTLWAVSQLIGGVALAGGCHFVAFLMVATSDPNIGMVDIVVSPFKAWRKLLGALPKRLAIVNAANAGVFSAVCAVGIIGGIPFENLLDWGVEAPPSKSLLGAVIENASASGESDTNMEEAMNNFAGDAVGDRGLGNQDQAKPKEAPKPVTRKKIDAIILGYKVDAAGRVSQLLIGTEHRGKLIYSGRVAPMVEEKDIAALTKKLRSYRAPQPIIRVPMQATWVHPRLTCRVSYESRAKSGVLGGLTLEKMLGEVRLPW